MLKPAQLRRMKPEARTQLFEEMARAFYGKGGLAERIVEDFDVSRVTYFNWRRQDNVPFAVLLTLDRWLHGEAKATNVAQDWNDIPAQLAEAAEALAKVATRLERIARLSAGISQTDRGQDALASALSNQSADS
jgi:hypothetical protein